MGEREAKISPAKSVTKVGVAVFGVGRIGQIRFQHLVEDGRADVLWLVDSESEESRIRQLISKHRLDGQTEFIAIESVDKVFSDERVKAVLVCTPTEFHEALIEKGLNAGKHVMTEKPMTFSIEKARQYYKEAPRRGLALLCAFNKRHDPGVAKIKKAISDGALGKLLAIRNVSRDPVETIKPEYFVNSGDIFHDTMIHAFDIVYFLTNEIPMSIVAFGHAHSELYAKIDDVDIATVMLKFPSGLIAVLENNRKSTYGFDNRLEVVGTDGMLKFDNPVPFQLEFRTGKGTTEEPTFSGIFDRYHESYKAQIEGFLDAVLGLKECEDIDDTAVTLSLRLADLATESLKSGQVLAV